MRTLGPLGGLVPKTDRGATRLLKRKDGEKFIVTHKDLDALMSICITWMYGGTEFEHHELVFVSKSYNGAGLTDDDLLLDMEVKCPDGVVRGHKGLLGPHGVRHSAADLVARRFCVGQYTIDLKTLQPLLRLVDAYDAYGDQFYLRLMPNLPESYGQAFISTGLIDYYRSNWGPMSNRKAFDASHRWLKEWIELNSAISLSDLIDLIPQLDTMILEINADLMQTKDYLPNLYSVQSPFLVPTHNAEWVGDSLSEIRSGYLIPTMVRRSLGVSEPEWLNWLETIFRTGLLYEFYALKKRHRNRRSRVYKDMKARMHSWFLRQSETLEWMLKMQLHETNNQIDYLENDVICFHEPITAKRHIVVAAMKRLGIKAYVARNTNGSVGNVRLRGNSRMDDPRILQIYFDAGETLQQEGGNLFCHSSGFMTSTNDSPSDVDLVKLSQQVELVVGETISNTTD